MVDFRHPEEAEAWFKKQSSETALAATFRYALRTIPLMETAAHPLERWAHATVLDVCSQSFRCLSVTYAAAKYSEQVKELRSSARNATEKFETFLFHQAAAIQYAVLQFAHDTNSNSEANLFASVIFDKNSYATANENENSLLYTLNVRELRIDAERLAAALRPEILASSPLWEVTVPDKILLYWQNLKSFLLAQNQDWDVWTRWYEARVNGEPSNKDLDLAIATIPNEDWEKGPAHVNKLIKALEDKFAPRAAPMIKRVTLQELASIASPTIVLTASGQIDAIPNPKFDLPIVEPDKLLSASNSLRKIIDITLAALPQNAPPALRRSFEIYNQELTDNPAIPILGDIVDFHDIIYAGWNEANAEQEWLTLSLDLSFKKFFARHIAFLAMFSSNDEKREILGRLSLDHAKVDLEASNKRLRVLDEAVLTLRPQKIFTSRFETELKNLRLEGEQLQAGQTIHPSEESTSLVKSFAAKSYGIFHAAGEECKRALALGGVLSAGYAALDFNGAKHLMLSWLLNVTK